MVAETTSCEGDIVVEVLKPREEQDVNQSIESNHDDAHRFTAVVATNDAFSLLKVEEYVLASLTPDGKLSMTVFLDLFRELLKFISSLGSLYAFVASDMYNKVTLLSKLQKRDPANYATVENMVEHESSTMSKDMHGTRNYLWLHRSIEFIIGFLESVRLHVVCANVDKVPQLAAGLTLSAEERDKCLKKESSEMVREVYMGTIAKHHAWFTHQLVKLASYATPSIERLLKMFGGAEPENLMRLNRIVDNIVKTGSANFSNLDKYLDEKGYLMLY